MRHERHADDERDEREELDLGGGAVGGRLDGDLDLLAVGGAAHMRPSPRERVSDEPRSASRGGGSRTVDM